ncbi:MAG: lysophospholipid acyltransferase family protein [Candidatus Binatia bacterium]
MTATRRILALALYAGAFTVLAWFIVPLLIAVATFDFLRGQPWTATRALAFFVWYLACELVGVTAGFLIWLASLGWAAGDPERYMDWNYALQNFWARMLGRGAFRIFGVRLELHGGEYRFGEAPIIVFVRHASVADTILAALLISVPHGTRLRYVLKQELLWDPCLDIVGNRLPNVFVRRDSAYTDREVAAVAGLARGLGPSDGVLIYPEGTRFSPSKKARIVEKLREQGRGDAAAEAEAFRHVLRPRSGGPFALLDVAPQADVVFLAHTGFEGSASFDRFFNGGLVGRTVHAELRVVKAADVPKDPKTRREWMMQNWHKVDEFIEKHRGLTSPTPARAPVDADAPVPR